MRLLRAELASDAFFLPCVMYICYLDESGTADLSGNTEHFVLVGLAIPASTWKAKDSQIATIKGKFGLDESEIHAAWMARDYPEQRSVPGFEALDHSARRKGVLGVRALNVARAGRRAGSELLKNYRKTEPYVHLARRERKACLAELAEVVGGWTDAKLFADACWKRHVPAGTDNFAFAFEQVVTRFHTYLVNTGDSLGILVQDNNQTVAKRLTGAMRVYHAKGTFFSKIKRIVETPLFVDSELTSIVQLADLCAYATRRFFDNDERELFDRVLPRFDRNLGRLVGLRHFTAKYPCRCDVCVDHGRV